MLLSIPNYSIKQTKTELILSKDWFKIVKENNINKLYLEDFPCNCLVENIKDFKILEKWENNTVLKVFIDNSYIIIDIKDKQTEIINKLEHINKNWERWYEKVEKKKCSITYNVYGPDKVKYCNSDYIEWESNTIWESSWEYTKDELHIKKKHFWIITNLFNLFSK